MDLPWMIFDRTLVLNLLQQNGVSPILVGLVSAFLKH